MKTKMYLDFIRESIKTEDVHTVDIANKMALEIGAITLDQYLAAAHILVDVVLGR